MKGQRVDAVERYLDELFDKLAGTGGRGRRALAEAEDHLNSAREELVEAGVPSSVAAEQAVGRFGEASRIAAELRIAHRDLAGMLRRLVSGGWLIGAVGLLAVGISGLITEAMGRIWGAGFVAGDVDGVTYTLARCAQYISFEPGHDCPHAAALHHWGEIVTGRSAAGVLGLLVLAGYVWARRRGPLRGEVGAVPWQPAVLVVIAVFGLASIALGGPALGTLVFSGGSGTGAGIADGTVAGLVALAAAGIGVRRRLADA